MKECPKCSGQFSDEVLNCKHCGALLKSYSAMMKDKSLEDPFTEDQQEYASLLSRVIGTSIDGVIAMILFLFTIFLLNQINLSNGISISFVIFIYYIFYFTWPIAKYSQTPGYMIMKIKVVKSSGANLGVISAFFRYAAKTMLGIISLIAYFFTKKKQSIHDMVVDSIVVYK